MSSSHTARYTHLQSLPVTRPCTTMSGPNAVSSHSDLSSKFGYLFKRGENNTELKNRFFQLRSKDMNYYKSHEDNIGMRRGASR
jgi:hypothetical protein